MAKAKEKIQVRFIGNNATDVTGSCIHIKTERHQILLECGLYQSCGSPLNDYKVNSSRLLFKPKEINYIFALHNHIDHIGKIPLLYAKGCNAEIIAPKGSKAIAEILLRDCAHINQKDAESLCRITGKDCPPLYTDEDVDMCLSHWTEYDIGEKVCVDNTFTFNLLNSGHILNSAQLELWLKRSNTTKKIVYTSDLGNISISKHYTKNIQKADKCNLLIAESTYSGDNSYYTNSNRDKEIEKIKNIVTTTCIDGGGKVLIPVFANDRCQNMLTYLYDIFGQDESFKIPVLVDSPMACKISKVYGEILDGDMLAKFNEVLSWKNIVFVEDYLTSKGYQESDKPMVVLSASGMLVAGRSVSWVAKLLSSSKNHIIFCGYSPEDSLAGKIKSGKQKTLRIDRKQIPNRCHISSLKTFSSHIQKKDMLEYYSSVHCEKVALVHGEFSEKCEFAKELQKRISDKSMNSKVIAVNKETEILL